MQPPSLPVAPVARQRRRRLAALIAAVALAALAGALEAYARWPSTVQPQSIDVAPDTRDLVLIFHGSFGREEPTLLELEQRFRELAAGRPGVQVVRYVWSPWSDNILRAAPRGVRIGQVLGAALARAPGIARLHLVAHSAGAYVLDPLCEAWRAGRSPDAPPATVAMTFLDPIGLQGLFDRGWGARHLGRCADRAEAVINTDDPAPATDRALARASTTDVTTDPGRAAFGGDGHRWPVRWYRDRLSPADLAGPVP